MKKKIIIIAIIVILIIIIWGTRNKKENSLESVEKTEDITPSSIIQDSETGEYVVYNEETGEEIARSEDEGSLYIYTIDPDYNPRMPLSEDEVMEEID